MRNKNALIMLLLLAVVAVSAYFFIRDTRQSNGNYQNTSSDGYEISQPPTPILNQVPLPPASNQ